MRQSSKRVPDSAEKTVRDIRRATRRHHSAEDKIRDRPDSTNRIGSLCNLRRWDDAAYRHIKKRPDLSLLHLLKRCGPGQDSLQRAVGRDG